jgi:hypothetical protein
MRDDDFVVRYDLGNLFGCNSYVGSLIFGGHRLATAQ